MDHTVPVASLTNLQARRFLLTHHGLGTTPSFAGKAGAMDFIRRVGCIQYDPLNIVGRNPELVLQSRIPKFKPALLQELLYKDRLLLDGMDKVMSIYPADDWPYFRRFREKARKYYSSIEPVMSALPEVREEIEARGPLSSDDLSLDRMIDWAWAPTRLARAVLESMYFWGELVVHHKKNNQKVYDFAVNHLPESLLEAAEPNVSEDEYVDWRILRRIGGVGLLWEKAGDAWIGLTEVKAKERQASFRRLSEQGRIVRLQVEGVGAPLYARTEDWDCLAACVDDPFDTPRASVIAPLDNLLWDRRLISAIFGFDYIWEVYKPVEQRSYGYYVLPILYGDKFVARFEPGRDKATGALVIKNWWWEQGLGMKPTKAMRTELTRCFRRFLDFLGADSVTIDPALAERESIAFLGGGD
ncbi:winged helix-turn-helix domain-containing protein [Paenibacillus thermotolerans]|uniref:winged helix-turn-helix domain-containing protein n=1 Tax=Paenibacillus thermotolerans TaxID=3027807 RepID=UPI002367609E|nr:MULTISPECIES: crosslink repair DNA glycosylase YcaQ family protein [unclassified Paenibacillus]